MDTRKIKWSFAEGIICIFLAMMCLNALYHGIFVENEIAWKAKVVEDAKWLIFGLFMVWRRELSTCN